MRARSAVAAALVAFAAAKVLARGNLLVHKHVSLDDRLPVLALGRNFSVTYGVYNVGQSPAYDIKVKDMWPESSFELLEGKPEASYKSIAACVCWAWRRAPCLQISRSAARPACLPVGASSPSARSPSLRPPITSVPCDRSTHAAGRTRPSSSCCARA